MLTDRSGEAQRYVEPYLQHLKIKFTIHIIYQLIILAVFVTVLGLFTWDLYSKYRREHQLAQLTISECRAEFIANRCDDPVPGVKELCLQKEICLMEEPHLIVGFLRVFRRMLIENINDTAQQISNRGLMVLGLAFLLVYGTYRLFPEKEESSLIRSMKRRPKAIMNADEMYSSDEDNKQMKRKRNPIVQ